MTGQTGHMQHRAPERGSHRKVSATPTPRRASVPAPRHAAASGTRSHAAGSPRTAALTASSADTSNDRAGRAGHCDAPRSRYIPALDGIRTFAVIAVVLYHLGFTWAQGGFQGVTIFFVLSGYLITRLLRIEFARSGTIDLKGFWVRRVRRLVPATVTLVVVVALLCTIFNHVMLTKMRPDILPSLLFFNNWWQIFNNVSYFGALGDPSPLTHFWSLAIEEQFYVVWPVLLFVLLRFGARRKVIRIVVAVLAVASALGMALLYNPAADPSRVYYGTDTRAFAMLVGALLAFVRTSSMNPFTWDAHATTQAVSETAHPYRGKPQQQGVLRKGALDIAGVAALAGLVALFVYTNGYTSFTYRGGTVIAAVLSAVLIAACVQPDGVLARVFSLPLLVWLGQRSYSIYLWHFPLFALMNPVGDVSAKPWWLYLIECGVVLIVAELSYHFIETPFRKGAFGAFLQQVASSSFSLSAYVRSRFVPVACAVVLVLGALGGLVFVPSTSALSEEGAALIEGSPDAATDDGNGSGDAQGADASASGEEGDEGEKQEPATDAYGFPADAYDVLMIGDSVSLRAVDPFNETFPYGHIDAMKNRQFSAAEELFSSYESQGLAGRVVVFALGTNGNVTDDAVDSLMELVGDKRIVVFVTTRSPQGWVSSTNAALKAAADRYDNVHIVDWYSYSEGRNDLFDGDGTHLSSQGAKEYVALIHDAVEPYLPYRFEGEERDETIAQVNALAEKIAQAVIAPLTK
ncbi:acyltransferase family protein [uncultured Enorma sp.]|uniref:acyltransferase family protein n=1 Tax=uncultured Enorma sp. TaxID=1714346 RepID=UPI002805DF86|nr:acyltransferase family protein [uncultured Enorma sp.]